MAYRLHLDRTAETDSLGGAGNRLVLGIFNAPAYVFARAGTSWAPRQKLPVPSTDSNFGSAVAAWGDTVVVGAPAEESPLADAGAVYVYREETVSPARFFTLPPCRVVDTRSTNGPALAANSTRTFAVSGLCQVPVDARAVAAVLTAVNPGDRGNLRLYPAELGPPLASAINLAAGATRANNAVFELGPGGQIKVQCDMLAGSTATTHFVLDVFGYFR